MDELKSILTNFFSNYYDSENDWYHWEIKDNFLPNGIELPNENRVTRNLILKEQVHSKWRQSDEIVKGEFVPLQTKLDFSQERT